MFTQDDVIYSYTREQAIEDGVLVDVSETAKEAGDLERQLRPSVHGYVEKLAMTN